MWHTAGWNISSLAGTTYCEPSFEIPHLLDAIWIGAGSDLVELAMHSLVKSILVHLTTGPTLLPTVVPRLNGTKPRIFTPTAYTTR